MLRSQNRPLPHPLSLDFAATLQPARRLCRQGFFWPESEVNDQLDHTIRTSFAEVLQYAETHAVSNRIGAYMLAIDRVAYTLRQRGIYA